MCIIPPVAARLELAGMHCSFKYDSASSFVSALSCIVHEREEAGTLRRSGCVLSLVVLGSKE